MICFVILHYSALDITIACIQSIQEHLDAKAYQIIVVDNHSPDGSGSKLFKRYEQDVHVNVLLLERNEGFANGNNSGYKYARDHFSPDYVVVMNNDTLLCQRNFVSLLQKTYEETEFDILGPDIVSGKDGTHQNPSHTMPLTIKQIEQLIWEKNLYLQARKDRKLWAVLLLYLWTVKNRCFPKTKKRRKEHSHRQIGCVLHGSCLIFSKHLFDRWVTLFDPATFLYMEEEILDFHCRNHGAVIVYDSAISIIHMEDISTNTVYRNHREKNIFKAEQMIQSAGYLLGLMREE